MTEPNVSTPRRWPFTFTQARLGVGMSAIAIGLTGMLRNDARLVYTGFVVGIVYVGMRIWARYRRTSPPPSGGGREG